MYDSVTKLQNARYAAQSGIENIICSQNNLKSNHIEEQMMHRDFSQYLPDNVLVKTDRASMHFGLEVRAPFLNRDIIAFANRLPFCYKLSGNQGKYILRKVLSDYVPNNLWDRPKHGFTPPISEWMRGSLMLWCKDRLFIKMSFSMKRG